jgi:TonB family protein
MVDSIAAHEGDKEPSGFSSVNGNRPGAERLPRTSRPTSDEIEVPGPEHASALLRMGVLKQESGDYPEAEELFRRALEIGERSLGPENPALVPALTRLASALVLSGKLEDAQKLAVRVVAVSENGPAEHEPDVAILINDLARLCLKQSAYGVAEPLLLRLLAIKSSKGEDHPEVGTVLSSLATVRQALGRHESAEQLLRRVLEIRERTLAPNHFALALALEHLGEACAARGKIEEALQLFQRAQTIRELTLGAGHQSLRTSRDRIADLQLQAEESLDGPPAIPAPTPEKYRLLATNNAADNRVSAPQPVRERFRAPRKGTARVIEQAVSTEESGPPALEESGPPSFHWPSMSLAAADNGPSKAESVPYRDIFLSIQHELEDEEDAEGTNADADFFESVTAAFKQRQKATLIGVGIVALIGVLATASRAWTGAHPATVADAPIFRAISSPATPSGAEPSSGSGILANDPANKAATASEAATPVTASRIRVADRRPAAKKPAETKPEPTQIRIPKVSSALSARVDSVVRAGSGVGEPFSFQPSSMAATTKRISFERDEAVVSPQRAQLIGSLPTPRVPSQLGYVEGEVRVRFDVDVKGRPVMSTVSVVSSPDALLTAAVLKVISGIRFVPARSGGPDSKPITDVVQLGFQFRPNE